MKTCFGFFLCRIPRKGFLPLVFFCAGFMYGAFLAPGLFTSGAAFVVIVPLAISGLVLSAGWGAVSFCARNATDEGRALARSAILAQCLSSLLLLVANIVLFADFSGDLPGGVLAGVFAAFLVQIFDTWRSFAKFCKTHFRGCGSGGS